MADLSTITLPSGDSYNLKDSNAVPSSEKAAANGVATLDSNGLVPQSQMPGMVILSYGNNTWDDFLAAYQKNNVIYCRASSNSNPASGSQTRLAFMAYVNNAASPTEVEFQYYRSVSSHNATQQGDQVYVYKLNKNNGWSVTVREAYTRITTSTGLTSSWSGGVLTEKAALVSETALTNAATAATEVANRVYPVSVDVNGKLAVNVPWESGSSLQWTIDNDGAGETSLQATIQNDVENNVASGAYSHAEGYYTSASGTAAHAECASTTASGNNSHAEGIVSTASGEGSHAEGYSTTASNYYSHAEGNITTASGYSSHAEGSNTTASGNMSHAEGYETIANHASQHVFGEYNIADPSIANSGSEGNYIEIVGNGTADDARSNARTLDWNGNETLAGKLTIGAGPTNNMDVATKQYVDNIVNIVYPVGSIYISVNSTSPATLFGGTWEALGGKFLLGADSTYTAGSTGGSADAIVPYHNHTFTGTAVTSGVNSRGHTHVIDGNVWGNYAATVSGNHYVQRVSGGNWMTTTSSGGGARANVSTGAESQNHTHNVTASGTVGYAGTNGNTTGANMPPYLSVYMWKRTA